jgi:hypothetical protein
MELRLALWMALVGESNLQHSIRVSNDPTKPSVWLQPVPGKPLRYQVSIDEGWQRLAERRGLVAGDFRVHALL